MTTTHTDTREYAILVRTHADPTHVVVWDRYYDRATANEYLPDAREDPDIAAVMGVRKMR